MRLKRLEIYGFKSFAERTRMEFVGGITGVVGPNGSGKSNISDAVRWVLGEQSAKTLRGARMEDVIFGGTQTRKPLNFCEVTLVFDNEDKALPVDFAEVQVTRRVYRSGESEYLLNKAACRLKDIVDLFRGTGIGKDGYSLIGQGHIDDILSVKSEDRRTVFEEAAGIGKFKARRQEAERRMENTTQNLERVQDILQEIGAKLPSLETQAQAARSYTRLMAEARVLEANAFLRRYDALSASLQELDSQAEDCRAQTQDLLSRRAQEQAQSAQAEEEVNRLDRHIAQLNESVLELTRQSQMHKGEGDLLEQRLASAASELERLDREEAGAHDQAGSLERLRAEKDAALQALRDELAGLQAQREALEARAGEEEQALFSLENQAETAKGEMIASFNQLTDVKAVLARLTATRESLLTQGGRLEESLQKTRQGLEAAEADRERAQAEREEAQRQLAACKEQGLLAAHEGAQLAASLEKEAAAGQRLEGALREAASRLKMLEQMRRDYDGYQNSVRELLRRFAGDPGLCGVVASLLTVPKELERAVEMALGAATQNIVCRREEDAKRMIEALRRERLGRATFLPLSAVRGRTLSAKEREALSLPGCLGVASELVSYPEEFRPVFENLLGRTVLARDLTCGIAIMRRGGHAFRLVTLEGDVMHSGGSMTGGSLQARTTSLLSRSREIAEYRQAVARLEERQAQGRETLQSLRQQASQNQARQQALSAQAHEQELALLRAEAGLQAASEAQQAAESALSSLLQEQERLHDSLAQIEEEARGLNEQTGRAEAASSTTQADIIALNERLRQKREALEQTRQAVSEVAAAIAASAAKQEALRREDARLLDDGEQLRRAKAVRDRARQALTQRRQEDERALAASKQAQLAATSALSQESDRLRQASGQRQEAQQALRAHAQALEDVGATLETQRDLLHSLETRQQRAGDERRQIADRLWERHELTYDSALELKTEAFQEKTANARIADIRAAIRQLGTVNLSAMQEYGESKERFDQLSSQKNDLEKAQRDLSSIIKDLTSQMEARFLESFSLINQHFSGVFSTLFGGGTALLKLQDERDCLSCGIDIVAQPPGKKLQLLSLLSGGERALTAIALLFSMLAIRPSPFCILDEIEAALDESNVDGFADYLRNYSKHTQFIVITHRKGTMERCDRLYGVAMEEKGVSRMVSVQLDDITKDMEEA